MSGAKILILLFSIFAIIGLIISIFPLGYSIGVVAKISPCEQDKIICLQNFFLGTTFYILIVFFICLSLLIKQVVAKKCGTNVCNSNV